MSISIFCGGIEILGKGVIYNARAEIALTKHVLHELPLLQNTSYSTNSITPPRSGQMPFLNTTPATSRRCVLGNKNRMTFHRGLFAVFFGILGCYPRINEIRSMFSDSSDTLILYILLIKVGKLEL